MFSKRLLKMHLVSSSFVSLPLSAPCSVIMHHHLQEDPSPSPTTDHPVQTIHIHHGPEQHRIRSGCLHGWGLGTPDGHQLAAGLVQLHREHRQHESPYSSHRGGQCPGARSGQPARHKQHHHHHCYRHHVCCLARLCRQHSTAGSASQVPLYRDPGWFKSLGLGVIEAIKSNF